MKPIPEPLYPCKYCADEYSWPATDLFWSNQDQDWICDVCWDDLDFMTASSGEEKGVCLADEIKKSEAKHDAEVIERETPDFKDPSTNNGDWRKDAEFRMGWNECIDVMKNRANQLRQKEQEY